MHRNTSIRELIRLNIRNQGGILSLWKGLVPTLWRDVPFSGVYWSMYEIMKDKLNTRCENNQINAFGKSFVAGAVSGGVATFITQPFDVIKTRRQRIILDNSNGNINSYSHQNTNTNTNTNIKSETKNINGRPKNVTFKTVSHIVKTEGISGLFSGLPARITKVPLACAIMISTYEVGKLFFSQNNI